MKTRVKVKGTRVQVMAILTFNPRILETEADGSLWVQGYLGLHKIIAETEPGDSGFTINHSTRESCF